MVYLIALFCAPVAAMVSYYLGLIVMTKIKIKQTDNHFTTHLLRVIFGLFTLFGVGIMLLSIFHLIK